MNTLKASLSILLTFGIALSTLLIPVAASAKQAQQKSTVEKLADIFRPTRRPSRSRGGGCLVTPGEKLWSDRPVFVWDFKVGKTEVRTANIEKIEVRTADDQRLVWSQVLTPNSQSAVYQGEPLQPGQYDVILYSLGGRIITDKQLPPRFTLIEAAKRQQIQAGLTQIENQLRVKNASVEAIALEKAIYFSEQELWSDAFQTIYSVPDPSTELRQFLPKGMQKMCEESEVAVTP